jgi:error-prone DNA polymerase
MVHPYLRRRDKKEPVEYPSEALRLALAKTLGVPLFQEQAMRIAIDAAGFSPAEADGLRRAMATFRHSGTLPRFRDKFLTGMAKNGYDPGFAERCFHQIEGFGEYGFPESHAASFALLVYVSAWIKCFHPAVFACALLNSQPMGFYAPAQIVRDAEEHGVEIRPVDVNRSDWDSSLEPAACKGGLALRLGLRQVHGLAAADGERLVGARTTPYRSPAELMRRAGLKRGALEKLASADAFGSQGLDRRQALWAVKGLDAVLPLFARLAEADAAPEAALPAMALGEHVAQDYVTMGLSLKRHPLALLRGALEPRGIIPTGRLAQLPNGAHVRVAGLVLVRQQPGSANGVIFMTLEDESGIANLIVWPPVFERFRRTVMTSRLVECRGRLQREGIVTHLIADDLRDLSPLLLQMAHGTEIPIASRDFH